MDEALTRLVLDVPYRTGPLARTDLHAGGLFFCVVYRECLQFGKDGRVRRWCEVLDDSRPFDDEAERFKATDAIGSYGCNHRGYIRCVFTDFELTGLPCKQAPGLLAFYAWRPMPGLSFSLVYSLEAQNA